MNSKLSSIKKVHTIFGLFRKKLRHIWEEYCFVEHYAPYLHEQIKIGSVNPFTYTPFLSGKNDIRETSRDKSLAVVGQVLQNSIKHRVLLDSIGAFEDNLSFLVESVYLDLPEKLKNTFLAVKPQKASLQDGQSILMDRNGLKEKAQRTKMILKKHPKAQRPKKTPSLKPAKSL